MVYTDPWSRTADQVTQYYIARPELIHQLLERLGAQHVSQDHKSFRCTCPLHDGDNSQAFAVWFDQGYTVWKCHTDCADKGNLVTLLMKKYDTGFQQAVVWLAQFARIAIDGPVLHISPERLHHEEVEEFKRLVKIQRDNTPNIFPDGWAHQARSNWHRPEAAEAIHLLTGQYGTKTASGDRCKQFPWDVLQEFEVGVVPAGHWVMQAPDFPSDPTRKSGWFENRIAIPWRNWEGQCIGFSGRRYDGQSYLKYKTYPGTKKATALYGLFDERCKKAISDTHTVVIVEGFSDVWRAWSHGIRNVVSPGGTELSAAQTRLLKRFDLRTVVFLYDGDPAGRASAGKMSSQVQSVVADVRIGRLPDGVDPDDLLTPDQYLAGINAARRV